MKKKITLGARSVLFYSINLCSYGQKGDYEVFSAEGLNLNLLGLKKKLENNQGGKWGVQAAQFSIGQTDITIYSEGRVIMEGVTPDSHERAFELLELVLEPAPAR